MEENRYCVYCHTTPDGLRYVGQTQQKPAKRWGGGNFYKANPRFTEAVKTFGWQRVKHEILASGLSKAEAYETERKYIELFGTTDPAKGYNKLDGEQHKAVCCVETGVVFESLHEARRETGIKRDLLKAACQGTAASAGGFHWCYADEKDNYEIDWNRKMPPKPKKVRNIETREIFNSIGEAAKKYGATTQQIGAVCNKKKHRKTAAKFHWEFVDESDTRELLNNV